MLASLAAFAGGCAADTPGASSTCGAAARHLAACGLSIAGAPASCDEEVAMRVLASTCEEARADDKADTTCHWWSELWGSCAVVTIAAEPERLCAIVPTDVGGSVDSCLRVVFDFGREAGDRTLSRADTERVESALGRMEGHCDQRQLSDAEAAGDVIRAVLTCPEPATTATPEMRPPAPAPADACTVRPTTYEWGSRDDCLYAAFQIASSAEGRRLSDATIAAVDRELATMEAACEGRDWEAAGRAAANAQRMIACPP